MKNKYIRMDLRTEKNFKIAEKLQEQGYNVIEAGVYSILLEKKED